MIDRQVDQLSSEQRHLTKVAVMDQINRILRSCQPEAFGPVVEIFMELELVNKPAYKNAYALQDSIDDPSSNLYIRQYAAPGAPVPLIRLFYRDKDHLKRLEATMLETNLLYSTERNSHSNSMGRTSRLCSANTALPDLRKWPAAIPSDSTFRVR